MEGPPRRGGAELFGRRDLPKEKVSWLRRHVPGRRLRLGGGGAVIVGLVVILLVLAVFFVPDWIVKSPAGIDELSGSELVQAELSVEQTRNSVRTTLVQAIGGALVLLTFAVGFGQLIVTRQGQLVDRFTKTIDQMGDESLDVRLGGIFALQQIARRPEYALPAAEMLHSYLKTHARLEDEELRRRREGRYPYEPADELPLAPDLQAALRILVGEGLWRRASSGSLDLSLLDLRHADLEDADLLGMVLLNTRLEGSNLRGVNLVEADLRGAFLSSADLTGADLSGADLSEAMLVGTTLNGAKLRKALLPDAILARSYLIGADLTEADLSNAGILGARLNAAHLDDAVLRGAELSGELTGATMFGVWVDETTEIEGDLSTVLMDDETRRSLEAE
ncbi:MAG TPA: pentapeptide repeat-containing protein [Solirubrobacterales bacterium]|nr:pentapeptide repeat-containing protein [Solirubrobacterales bacterium]